MCLQEIMELPRIAGRLLFKYSLPTILDFGQNQRKPYAARPLVCYGQRDPTRSVTQAKGSWI
jgi:hypothetical protein